VLRPELVCVRESYFAKEKLTILAWMDRIWWDYGLIRIA